VLSIKEVFSIEGGDEQKHSWGSMRVGDMFICMSPKSSHVTALLND